MSKSQGGNYWLLQGERRNEALRPRMQRQGVKEAEMHGEFIPHVLSLQCTTPMQNHPGGDHSTYLMLVSVSSKFISSQLSIGPGSTDQSSYSGTRLTATGWTLIVKIHFQRGHLVGASPTVHSCAGALNHI